MNEETRKMVLAMTLMSDILFNAVMNNNKECMEYILKIIMDKADLQVHRVEVQHTVPNPFSRGVRYDVFATDEQDNEYDIEVQQADSGAVPKRGRYNSSMMDYMYLDKNQYWNKLPNTYVIFITENDVLGGDLPIYHINRHIEELNYQPYGDGTQIIYVNGAYEVKEGEEKTALMTLIEDFRCANADNMKSAVLAARMRQIKNSEEEMNGMCKEVEKYAEKKAIEAKTEDVIEMLKDNLSLEKISQYTRLTIEQITAIGKQAALL